MILKTVLSNVTDFKTIIYIFFSFGLYIFVHEKDANNYKYIQ